MFALSYMLVMFNVLILGKPLHSEDELLILI